MSDGRFAQDSDAAPDDVTIPDPTDPAQQGLNRPAPIIDLGGDVEPGPSRPLGPRRLALLREQMAKHQQEIERSGTDDPTHVDPELAQKQRRIAELASRAAISSEEDRRLADEAIAQTQSIRPITDEYLASLDEQDTAVTQQGVSSLEEAPDEASEQTQPPEQDTEADPSDSAIEQTPWSQPVPVVPMPSEQEDDQPLADSVSEADSVTEAAEGRSGDHPGEEPEGASVGDAAQGQSADNDEDPVEAQPAAEPVEEQPHDDGEQAPEPAGSDDSVGQIDSAQPIEEHASSLESAEAADAEETEETSTEASAAQPDAAAETEQAPSEPVRAVNAQGLQLMDPKDYRTPSDWRTPVLTIAAILVLVLLAILIIFVIP